MNWRFSLNIVHSHRVVVVLFAGLSASVGCGPQVGAFLEIFFQPKVKVEAEYTLTDGPLLILVDTIGNPPTSDTEKLITEAIAEQFKEHEVNERMIPARHVSDLRRIEADYEKLSATAIGKRLGAEQVLFLKVSFVKARELADDELITPPSCTADLRVVDPKATRRAKVRLWPRGRADGPGKIIEVKVTLHRARAAGTRQARAKLLADILADKVAKLFYTHHITSDDPEPGS